MEAEKLKIKVGDINVPTIKELNMVRKIAISMDGVTIGRQVDEGDILYSAISEDEYRKFKKLKKFLKDKEKEVLKEIATQMRKNNIVWGV